MAVRKSMNNSVIWPGRCFISPEDKAMKEIASIVASKRLLRK